MVPRFQTDGERCASPRARSTHNGRGATCGVALASARHARLRSLTVPLGHRGLAPRAAAENRPGVAVLPMRCAHSRFVSAIAPARRPSPPSPPPRPPSPSLPSVAARRGVYAPLPFRLRSARRAGARSVRPLLPAQSPAHPWRKVARPRPPRSTAQSPAQLSLLVWALRAYSRRSVKNRCRTALTGGYNLLNNLKIPRICPTVEPKDTTFALENVTKPPPSRDQLATNPRQHAPTHAG